MMIYKVRAKLKTETAADFLKKLTDGTILSQRPDGAEMVNSMNRAVVTVEESVEWSEQCFCSTPLAHERATVLDTYFEGILTEPIDDYRYYEGEPFMGYLKQIVGWPPRRNGLFFKTKSADCCAIGQSG